MAKQDKNKYIRTKALQIAKLEKEISLGNNVQENKEKIQIIMSHLSSEDLGEVILYIEKKKIL